MQWNGALVGRERDDVAGGGFELGFDDGDVRLYGKADLREFFDQGTIKALATTQRAAWWPTRAAIRAPPTSSS